jgi:hypothetical protein
VARSAAYSQNLDEMDFTRGIWFAAINGEVEEVQKYLDKKSSPDVLDSSGYSALVIINTLYIVLRFNTPPDHRSPEKVALHHVYYFPKDGKKNICWMVAIPTSQDKLAL